ncbi:phosphatidylethanolamine N-methyltransferase isoform X1 [Pezoporus occidentalis]|uniref:phosphatidylethanolamine N-methyltransferase isoform X1 n=2 Tax=Pezoporus occidentalis TaxID=407982 RepID=UPI002F9188A1
MAGLAGGRPFPWECCEGLGGLEYGQVDVTVMARLFGYVDVTDSAFIVAALSIAFNPLFWNMRLKSIAVGGRWHCKQDVQGLRLGAEGISAWLCSDQPELVWWWKALGRQRGLCSDAVTHVVSGQTASILQPSCNRVARWEHNTRALSRVFGSPHAACYCLGAVILLLNCVRSHCFTEAMKSQPKLEGLDCHWAYYLGLVILAVGTLFVITSFLALGFTGTFLGDYFGILMEAKVTSFPFSVLDNPMYWGSTAVYLGWSLMHASPAGLLLTAVVAVSYTIATLYEGPFTEEIYRQKQKGAKSK